MSITERKLVTEAWVRAVKETKQHLMIQVGGAPLPDIIELVSIITDIQIQRRILFIPLSINSKTKIICRRNTQVICAWILYSAYQSCTSNLPLLKD